MWRAVIIALSAVVLGVLAWPTGRVWCQGRLENNVGAAYARGLGVGQDEAEAVRWYERGAYHGSAAAAFNLGFAAQNGRGTPVDLTRAQHWYEKAARSGVALAGNNLALLYADSALGPADLVRARAWLKYSLAHASGSVRDTIQENLTAIEREMKPVDIASSDALLRADLR